LRCRDSGRVFWSHCQRQRRTPACNHRHDTYLAKQE
jgi:hypothetical protein